MLPRTLPKEIQSLGQETSELYYQIPVLAVQNAHAGAKRNRNVKEKTSQKSLLLLSNPYHLFQISLSNIAFELFLTTLSFEIRKQSFLDR